MSDKILTFDPSKRKQKEINEEIQQEVDQEKGQSEPTGQIKRFQNRTLKICLEEMQGAFSHIGGIEIPEEITDEFIDQLYENFDVDEIINAGKQASRLNQQLEMNEFLQKAFSRELTEDEDEQLYHQMKDGVPYIGKHELIADEEEEIILEEPEDCEYEEVLDQYACDISNLMAEVSCFAITSEDYEKLLPEVIKKLENVTNLLIAKEQEDANEAE